MLLRKDSNRGDCIDKFRTTTLLNAPFSSRFNKDFTWQVGACHRRFGTQTSAISRLCIQDNIHLTSYNTVKVVKRTDTDASLINIQQSKSFARVDHLYQRTVLKTAGFRNGWVSWIVGVYSDILVVTEDHISTLFRRNFCLRPVNNFLKSLAWQCYWSNLPVCDKHFKGQKCRPPNISEVRAERRCNCACIRP